MNLFLGVFLLFNAIFYRQTYGFDWPFDQSSDKNAWDGRWFPQPPGKAVDDNPSVDYRIKKTDLYDSKHGIKMGVSSPHCDDAKVNLTIDWNFSPINYTCFENKRLYMPRYYINPTYVQEYIPPGYAAEHKCMDSKINYDRDVPTYGTHRPLWAKWGEYLFLPKQRWLHNLEHGAIVMLYHPCANKMEVNALRQLVDSCLYRHIITPYTMLPPDQPLALVAWGHRLMMSVVDPTIVIDFIRKRALHGPEQTSRDGQYDVHMIEHSKVVAGSDIDDSNICPFFKPM